MTAGIFKEWFKEIFVPEVRKFLKKHGLPEKALLLLDNAPSHPPVEELLSDDGLIQVMYMPPNVTPLIQPMDQNVIRLTKLHYRSMFLAMVVANKSKDMNVIIKQYNLRDAILNLSRAWNKLEPATIKKCWKNIFESQSNDDRENTIPLATLRQELLSLNSIVETNLNLLEEIDPGQDFERGDIEEWNKDDFVEHDENCTACLMIQKPNGIKIQRFLRLWIKSLTLRQFVYLTEV
ncbi:jerky protein homolog-like [Anthonomus grandis grandis]|uniref:jerky protein homolog-like n=1 Tax=Anthonomus grandis grandis TaxID=2921223 RepID=UPI0021652889|nr:jerky protein homolog-like [Anthonomus grandis grandis]